MIKLIMMVEYATINPIFTSASSEHDVVYYQTISDQINISQSIKEFLNFLPKENNFEMSGGCWTGPTLFKRMIYRTWQNSEATSKQMQADTKSVFLQNIGLYSGPSFLPHPAGTNLGKLKMSPHWSLQAALFGWDYGENLDPRPVFELLNCVGELEWPFAGTYEESSYASDRGRLASGLNSQNKFDEAHRPIMTPVGKILANLICRGSSAYDEMRKICRKDYKYNWPNVVNASVPMQSPFAMDANPLEASYGFSTTLIIPHRIWLNKQTEPKNAAPPDKESK